LANNNVLAINVEKNSSIHPRVPQHNRNVGHFAFESIMHRGDIILHAGVSETSLHVWVSQSSESDTANALIMQRLF